MTSRIKYFILVYIISQVILVSYIPVSASDDYPMRFGHGLYAPVYDLSPLDAGQIYFLTSQQRAVLNIENTADLISNDLRFYHPDFVTAGREIYLSSGNIGTGSTKVLWRGRPFRDPSTLAADLSLLPPYSIGGLRMKSSGLARDAPPDP